MPQTEFTTSAIGLSIVNSIENFIKNNSNSVANDTSAKPEDGAKALANAIAYGISKALASPAFIGALQAGVGLTAGPLISTTLNSVTIEVK